MIKQFEKNPKEIFGENLGRSIKGKMNWVVHFILARMILGGISGVYGFTRGFLQGWKEVKLKSNL